MILDRHTVLLMGADRRGRSGEQPKFAGSSHDMGMHSSMCFAEEVKGFS